MKRSRRKKAIKRDLSYNVRFFAKILSMKHRIAMNDFFVINFFYKKLI